MIEFTYRIGDSNGMHARPAGKLATYAKQFDSEIRVRMGEKEADAKRLLSLMSLGAPHGAVLHFSIKGDDEEECGRLLEEYCRGALGGETEA